jgi:3-oxoacyl-(acyl-carrier-protein) synthase
VLTGGYDALSPFAWSGLSALRTMTKDEIRPFDKNRAGTLFSEGAGAILIESLSHARHRGAPILAEFLGGWLNNNAHHMTAPAKAGAGSAEVMQGALRDGGVSPDRIDHVNAHGTGTKHNDVTETQAVAAVFGDRARRIPITANKSVIGHMMGAAGSVESIASVLSLRDQVVPPTIHYETPDPDCNLDYVVNAKRDAAMSVVLSNSAGIGGCNAAVVLARYGDHS